uniref:uncharacterized protein LOC120345547 n=1 Tax=Styela clava TaxID=7725 RepID=UPI00193A3FCF|nr:uncharacterized protein LOC120345547 [Styela clava]
MADDLIFSPQPRMFIDLIPPEEEFENVTIPLEGEELCEPLKQSYLLVVSVAPGLVAVENLAFLFAVLLYRKKLKHNNVYTYVTSALIANVLTSLWAFYHFINYYFGLESKEPTHWWAFRKGMTAGFSLILCGNIGLLIYAIEDNTYMVGRLVSGTITTIKSNNRMNRNFRWRKALFLITFAWIIPVIYGLLAMTPWNCTWDCTCTLYLASGTPLCPGKDCSRLYTPMAKSYLLCIVIIWALECGFLLFVICKAAISFPKLGSPSNRVDNAYSTTTNVTSPDPSNNNLSKRKSSNIRKFSPKMARSYRFPFFLLGLFICCTMPAMILFILDFALLAFKPGAITVNVITPLPLLYCVISPILLTKRLSGMRSAVQMALSFNWLKGGCNNFSNKRRKSMGNSTIRGSVISVTRNSEAKFDSKGSMPPTSV